HSSLAYTSFSAYVYSHQVPASSRKLLTFPTRRSSDLNTVYIENLVGRDTQFHYRYRQNASNIVKEHDATALWTYARGYGDYEDRSEEHTSELQSRFEIVCRLLLGKKKKKQTINIRMWL